MKKLIAAAALALALQGCMAAIVIPAGIIAAAAVGASIAAIINGATSAAVNIDKLRTNRHEPLIFPP